MPSVAFYTLGCKLNQYETEAIREIFLSLNYKEVPYTQIADYYIINTCTVTAKTNRRSRQLVYQAHRRNPQAKIIITGCYAQIASEELQKIPGVSLIIGNNEKSQLIEYLESNTSNNIFVEDILQVKEYLPLQISQFTGYTRAFVKIQDGCDNFCTYCIVPYVRGPSRSRPLEDIVNEVKRLLDTGYREIVLVAVHLGTYGKDLQSSLTLIDVLENLLKLPKLVRLRLTSIEPTNFTDDLIDFIANEKDKICRHFHIPLQSGDKEILKRMRRPYTPSFYKDLLMRIANKIPDVSIGADVIIGFPSETEENFQNTYNLIANSPLNYLHVFNYSQRPGTPAADFNEQVPVEIRHNRSKRLRALGKEKDFNYRNSFIGKKLNVIILSKKDKNTGLAVGLSDNYIKVLIETDAIELEKNQFCEVIITNVEDNQTYSIVSKGYN